MAPQRVRFGWFGDVRIAAVRPELPGLQRSVHGVEVESEPRAVLTRVAPLAIADTSSAPMIGAELGGQWSVTRSAPLTASITLGAAG